MKSAVFLFESPSGDSSGCLQLFPAAAGVEKQAETDLFLLLRWYADFSSESARSKPIQPDSGQHPVVSVVIPWYA